MQLAADDARVLSDPPAQAQVVELADNAVNLILRFWVKSADHWPVKFDFTRAVKIRLDQEGIEIPFPQRVVHIVNNQNS